LSTFGASTFNGCVLRDTVIVTISPKPGIQINDTLQCLNENNFQFNIYNSPSTSTYSWRIDGKIINGKTAQYSYKNAGIKTVWLRATNDEDCKDSNAINLTVFKNPVANVSFTQNKACINEPIQLFNNSIINPTGLLFNWNFGDGNTSNIFKPVHYFKNAGTYNISYTVEDKNACSDTASNTLQ